MKLKFAFARKVAVGLIAVGSLACLATDTFAANRTWTSSNITSGNYRTKWGTAFASNWAGSVNPTTADVATFGTNAFGQYALSVQAGTEVGGVRFNNTGTNSYAIGGQALGIGTSGVNNQSGRVQNFGSVNLIGNQTWSGGSGASIIANNTELNGKNLTLSTDVTLNTLANSQPSNSLVTVAGGNTYVAGGGPDEHVNFAVTSGFLSTLNQSTVSGFDTTDSTLDVSGTGTYNNTVVGSAFGETTWNTVTMSAGTVDMMGVGGTMVANSYTQTGGGIVHYAGYDNVSGLISSTVDADALQYGGALTIDFSGNGAQTFNVGDAWHLFIGTNPGGNAASNFSTAVLTNVDAGSPYAGLSFTQYGTEWTTAPGTDGTWLVFQSQTGNLVVVPEPSTIVFAGLGVAMSGWTMWKKRRLSKLLAAKAG